MGHSLTLTGAEDDQTLAAIHQFKAMVDSSGESTPQAEAAAEQDLLDERTWQWLNQSSLPHWVRLPNVQTATHRYVTQWIVNALQQVG